eukprot:CAMPEP_0173469926 /NCGR_PEP_ID=MMETSP1357-20121228/77614_1 /TAXON_ID=77926 /ORGANISM="Hemiselmis rufescens, Strain PCC563" /LENGTH=217 /DNA_ID=CAMNT_0014438183 /DNA_START=286 /DNA_END=939 /DNA_ORIENTATION=+
MGQQGPPGSAKHCLLVLCGVGPCPLHQGGGEGTEGTRDASLDLWRTASMFGWGGAVNGGAVTLWLKFLEMLFPSHGQTLSRVVQKIAFNQACASPWLNGGFFGVATARNHNVATPEGRQLWLEAWGSKVRQDLPSTVCWSFAVWAPAHFINFLYVPPHLRVVYTNMVFFSWTVFLSYVGYRPPVQPTPQGDSMPCITPPSSKLGPAGVVSRVSLGGA